MCCSNMHRTDFSWTVDFYGVRANLVSDGCTALRHTGKLSQFTSRKEERLTVKFVENVL